MMEHQHPRLVAAATAAHENNQSTEFMDETDRRWFVAPAIVDNRSKVLIQAQRGQTIKEVYLPTETFTPAAAEAAISELDGALQ